VTGANGLLGQKLLNLLQHQTGIDLIGTTRSGVHLPYRASYARLDLTNANAVSNFIESLRPQIVIHTAAMTQVDECELNQDACWRVNADAVRSLTSACSALGCYFMYLSTDFVFSGAYGPLDEDDEPAPINFYGRSKLAGEQIVVASGLPFSIIRTALVYGVTHDQARMNIVLWVKQSLEQGKAINVVNDQWRTPTLAEDLAEGCWRAASLRATGIFHISGSEVLSPYQIALRTAEHFRLDSSLIRPVDSESLRQVAKRPPRTGFIIEKAQRELSYKPRTFADGLAIIGQQVR
jgi:dTDP-4-dehydrorhamnose reductase